jgi:hypothetical protein
MVLLLAYEVIKVDRPALAMLRQINIACDTITRAVGENS